jgi:hypothetical protein
MEPANTSRQTGWKQMQQQLALHGQQQQALHWHQQPAPLQQQQMVSDQAQNPHLAQSGQSKNK